jgi:hypothetical protein
MRSARVQLLLEIGIPLLLLAVLDVGFRFYLSQPDTELIPQLFGSPLTTGKYLAFRQREKENEPVDVLLMGMSQMMRVSAGQLSAHLEERYRRPIGAFNFAAPAHSVELDRRILEDIVVPLEVPRVLVYGVIPTNLIVETTATAMETSIRQLPVFSFHRGTPAAWLQRTTRQYSPLLLYREAIRSRLPVLGNTPAHQWVKVARQTDPFGDTPLPSAAKGNAMALNAWERSFIPRFARFDELMETTPFFANLERLAASCRAHSIRLVVMNNDVTPLYLKLLPRGLEDYRRFNERLREAAASAGVPLFDPTEDALGDPALFVDATHYGLAGMRWVTEALADYLTRSNVLGLPHFG